LYLSLRMSGEEKKTDSIEISPPDDFHLHVRDGDILKSLMPDVAKRFKRALIMPNLKPPVTTTKLALAYKGRIMEALKASGSPHTDFHPLMSLYLTDYTLPDEIRMAKESGSIFAVKFYPAGATTNSASGVTDIQKVYPVLKKMEAHGVLLLIHSEVTDSEVDIFDREKEFIERYMPRLTKDFPNLKIVLEHITTKDAVEYVKGAGDNVAATITCHHMLCNRNDIFKGGLNPHRYCLPVLKREEHRRALVEAATAEDNSKFFAGTDSAPHAKNTKESSCGCAGCFTSFASLELYAEVFDKANALHKLEAFVSENGARFYGLPKNKGIIFKGFVFLQ